MLFSTVSPLSVSTSYCTYPRGCVNMYNAILYILFNNCQYLTLYCLLLLCQYVHYCLLQSVPNLSVPLSVEALGSVPLFPLLFSTVCPLSANQTVPTIGFVSLYPRLSSSLFPMCVSTSHCTICCFCVTMSNVVSAVCLMSVST
jgi:hypothetical protein